MGNKADDDIYDRGHFFKKKNVIYECEIQLNESGRG